MKRDRHILSTIIDISQKNPDKTAIADEHRLISYKDLLKEAQAVAATLKNNGQGHSSIIGISLDKSVDYIISILAIWLADAAFTPLDNSYPEKRTQQVLVEGNINFIISKENISLLKESAPAIAHPSFNPDNLAYVIYTSGSSGIPKGSLITHQGLPYVISEQIKYFHLKDSSKCIWYLNKMFDASMSDILVSLCSGATLYIPENTVYQSLNNLYEFLQYNAISLMDIPPSLLSIMDMSSMPESLTTIIIGGEICQAQTIRKWAKKYRLINVYGPTEATICTSLSICSTDWNAPFIGKPLDGITYHISNEGELIISGKTVGKGYINKSLPENDRFITFNGEAAYLTGDLVKYTGNNYTFCARKDRQFKINGKLINPEEIEAAISAVTQKKCAVIKSEGQLIAFIGTLDADLQKNLTGILPGWMIPSRIIELKNIPITPSGKIDFSQLHSHPDLSVKRSDSLHCIKKVFENILKKPVNDDADLISEGIDSFGVIEAIVKLEQLGISISPQVIYEQKTIKNIVNTLSIVSPKSIDAIIEDIQVLIAEIKKNNTANKATQNILLTGATGFFGSRVLYYLLQNKGFNIYCIIRGGSQQNIMERVLTTFERYNLKFKKEYLKRIHAISGDITKKHFDMDTDRYNTLATKIDTIYHLAGEVNLIKDYDSLKAANVTGTKNIIDFCLNGNEKTLNYASTLSVFVNSDIKETTLKENIDLCSINTLYGGYAQSKWAAEYLINKLIDLGIKVNIFRYGLLTGDSRYGIAPKNDFLQIFLKSSVKTGIIPISVGDMKMDITPVDIAAGITVKICHSNHENTHFHIANPVSLNYNQLIEYLSDFGVRSVDCILWKKTLLEAESLSNRINIINLCRIFDNDFFNIHKAADLFLATGFTFDMSNTFKFVSKKAIIKPDRNLIHLYIKEAMKV
ncbi:MAG: hypothetical protein A2X42_06335 [Candidatus Margulisbacteria bacterium GWF2_38_17]|nr:MAG: hypothetical protein A2X42_06335 [Candidatus Margulisbacteria bacterium GWF2_38_17]